MLARNRSAASTSTASAHERRTPAAPALAQRPPGAAAISTRPAPASDEPLQQRAQPHDRAVDSATRLASGAARRPAHLLWRQRVGEPPGHLERCAQAARLDRAGREHPDERARRRSPPRRPAPGPGGPVAARSRELSSSRPQPASSASANRTKITMRPLCAVRKPGSSGEDREERLDPHDHARGRAPRRPRWPPAWRWAAGSARPPRA